MQKDEVLIQKFIKGDTHALEILIRRYKSLVSTYIMAKINDKNDANDVFQDVFIKVINKLRMGGYFEQGAFAGWVIGIARNEVIDFYRKKKHEKGVVHWASEMLYFQQVIESFVPMDPLFMDVLNKKNTLMAMLEKLSEEQRTVIILRYHGGFTVKEIAENMNLNHNTVASRIHYGLNHLKKYMNEAADKTSKKKNKNEETLKTCR